jgi:hypothetical protein
MPDNSGSFNVMPRTRRKAANKTIILDNSRIFNVMPGSYLAFQFEVVAVLNWDWRK